ncbi:Uncharacterized protein BM_BM13336 [Brugia malayi]|uniref:Bm13336 n=1 Tax=Brugia malayi TaxID=6279 RepID=A0A0J9YBQ6_BRUMA|nr:Uncharacterized protein BM_BM13336 [Brugia malayi]CDQ06039.1 Bm13336 [Brugia malayi]VIO88255.1 Uncharacterized protein BM_BM13336 [Brugia malayi]
MTNESQSRSDKCEKYYILVVKILRIVHHSRIKIYRF